MNELTGKIQTEIKKVIVGKDDVVRRVLMAILAQGHVLLEDVPGVGKTTLAMAFAKTLGLESRARAVHLRYDALGHHRLFGVRQGYREALL